MRLRISFALPVAAMILAARMLSVQTQTEPEATEKVGGGVSAPRATYTREPEFSELARAVGYQGVCTLGLIVGADGKPRNIHVINRIGLGLDEKAIEAVRSWRFSPALKNGQPVAVQIAVEVDFHLYGNPNGKFANLSVKARDGDAEAQLGLADLFLKSRGSREDEQLGLSYLEKAASQGLPRAQFLMGEHIARMGASADYPKAYMWLTLAQRGGEKHSAKALKELNSKIRPDQLQAGQVLVDDWKPTTTK
jgi:TonB family protein